MDELLIALKKASSLPDSNLIGKERESTPEEDEISGLACSLFITNHGQLNYAQVNEFERFAPCKIVITEQDSFGPLICCIKYSGRKYYFG